MEKECAKACLKKHMVVYKDLVKWDWRTSYMSCDAASRVATAFI
jgi:hypothetical protein